MQTYHNGGTKNEMKNSGNYLAQKQQQFSHYEIECYYTQITFRIIL